MAILARDVALLVAVAGVGVILQGCGGAESTPAPTPQASTPSPTLRGGGESTLAPTPQASTPSPTLAPTPRASTPSPTVLPTLASTQDPYIKTSDKVYLRSCSIPSADESNKVYRSFNDDLAVMAPSWVPDATKDTLATYKIAHENGQDYVSTNRVVHIESTEADYSMYCSAAFNVAFWKGVSPDVPWTGNNDRNWLIRKRDTAGASDPRIKFGEEVVISTQKEDYAIQVNGYQAGYKELHYVACAPGYGGDLEKKYGPGSTQCFKFERA